MSLGVVAGDEVDVEARGREAALAVDAIASLIANELETVENRTIAVAPLADRSPSDVPQVKAGDEVAGVVASRGYAIGRAYVLVRTEREVAEQGSGIAHESAALDAARKAVRRHLESLHAATSGPRREIVEAHLEFLDDPQLEETAHHWIAQGAARHTRGGGAVRSSVDALASVEDARLRERADDLLDLEGQVLASLAGEAPGHRGVPEGSVVVAAELLPSEFAALDRQASRASASLTAARRRTSRSWPRRRGVPMIVAAGPSIMTIAAGTWLLVDAEAGRVRVDPSIEVREQARREIRCTPGGVTRRTESQRRRSAGLPTACGSRFLRTSGRRPEARDRVRDGAEGCGLLRTEFLFLERRTAPERMSRAADSSRSSMRLAGRTVVIRTLDAAATSRSTTCRCRARTTRRSMRPGVRLSLHRPDLLRTQLAAILRVRPLRACRIMLPMVQRPDEIRRVVAVARERRSGCGRLTQRAARRDGGDAGAGNARRGHLRSGRFPLDRTNDLTQYTLAMDRHASDSRRSSTDCILRCCG
jgi:phosphocarrier protein FPr/phosphocarrier protein